MLQRPFRACTLLLLLGGVACSTSTSEGPPPAEAAADAKKAAAADPPAPPEPGLTHEALSAVLEPAKIDVRRTCRPLTRQRERVDVDLTIVGASGAVTHTNIRLNGGNPELARCVANELARVTFPPAPRVTRATVSITF